MTTTALIAEDEPLLAANLQAELARLWPDLHICASVGDGKSAVVQGLALQPDVLFLDISMPGMTGIDAVQDLAEEWPPQGKPFPLVVFVTAYDRYAVQAFERAAFDYLLKPVQPERLGVTCARLQASLQERQQATRRPSEQASAVDPALGTIIDQLRGLIGAGVHAPPTAPSTDIIASPLRVIQVSSGSNIIMVHVDTVLYFEAVDKYIRVVTATGEHLIRSSLRELMSQLDLQLFWQIHRSTIVRCDAITSALRHESGKLTLTLKGTVDKLTVSRLYAHLFKGM